MGMVGSLFTGVAILDPDRWAIVECLVQPSVVEPRGLLEDGEIEL
jgi:hypothetical protein